MKTESAFDPVAAHYDQEFTRSFTGRQQRDRVHRFLNQLDVLRKPARVLELNCGTGEDALWLAGKGHHVTATDLSEQMLAVAREKSLRAGGQKGSIRFLRYDLANDQAMGWDSSFDLVFSNFGGLNCLDAGAISRLSVRLSTYLRPGGRLIFVVMGRQCLTEQLYFLVKGSTAKAFRRKSRDPVNVPLTGGNDQPTWYYHPRELDQLLSVQFRRTHLRPIGFLLPPSYLDSRVSKHPRLMRWLDRLDVAMHRFPFLADRADHYLAAYTVQPIRPVAPRS